MYGPRKPRIRHIFDTVNRACLSNCPSSTSSFTLSRVRFRAIRESLIVAGLGGGIRSGVFRFMLLVHVLTEVCYRPRASLGSFISLAPRSTIQPALTTEHDEGVERHSPMMVLTDISAAPAAAGNRIPQRPSTYRAHRNLLPTRRSGSCFDVAFTQFKDSRTMLQITSHQGTIRSTGADRYPSIPAPVLG